MRHSRLRTSIGATAAAVPASAQANAGIGLLTPSAVLSIPALVPAILVEGTVLARMLGMRLRRALWISFLANLASTLGGAAIAIAFDLFVLGASGPPPGRELLLASLVPMFFVTWWLELLVVRRMIAPDSKPRARRATFAANALTYALMAVALLFVSFPDSLLRSRVIEGLGHMTVARMDVAEHFERTGTFPPPGAIAFTAKTIRSLARERDGRLVLVFALPESPEGDGRRIVQEPRVEGKRIVEWTCHSPDIPPAYLPVSCRRRAP